jgi:hypothetical protein
MVPMTGILAIGWGARGEEGRRGFLDKLGVAAAAILMTASTAATILEQSALDEGARSPARAEDGGARTLPARETLVGAFTGVPYTYPSPVKIEKTGAESFTIDPVHWYTDPFKSPIYYGVRVARWFGTGKTGAMVDFIHSKAIAELDREASFSGQIDGQPLAPQARIRDVVSKMEFSHGHNMLLFNGLLRLPGIGAHLSPYIGAGAGVLLPHTEVDVVPGDRPRTYEYNYAGPAGQALAGIELRLSRLSLFVEYKFTYGKYGAPLSQMNGSWLFLDIWRQINRWVAGEAPAGGHITTDIVSHQVVGGLAVRFAARP